VKKIKKIIEIVTEMLEKQIPKKPTGTSDYFTCPTCKSEFVERFSESGCSSENFNYCGNCGQKLKWGEKDVE